MSSFKDLEETMRRLQTERYRQILEPLDNINRETMAGLQTLRDAINKPFQDLSRMFQDQADEMLKAFSSATETALASTSWVDDALRIQIKALEPEPVFIAPLRRADTSRPRNDAFTWAHKQVARKKRIESSGKEPFCLLITPQGDKLFVHSFTIHNADRVQFFFVGGEIKTVTIPYDQIDDEYQFILIGLDKPEPEESKEDFVN